jgi:8-oxo-dGTP diphosphatase
MNAEEIKKKTDIILGNISINCVVFGFNNGDLKVLLTKWPDFESYMLPGGFIYKNENLNDAVSRVLQERTGVKDIYLKQFEVFGDTSRVFEDIFRKHFQLPEKKENEDPWFAKRYISIGYYALVDYTKVDPTPENNAELCMWKDAENCPELSFDHQHIFEAALKSLRYDFLTQHIGLKLLPETFTISQVQELYESFLKTTFVRSNFQRKILNLGILERKEKQVIKKPHKAPFLYSFRPDWTDNYHLFI